MKLCAVWERLRKDGTLPCVFQEHWCYTTHSSGSIRRFQSYWNSFLAKSHVNCQLGSGMIFHSNLAAAAFKQKTGRRAKEVMYFLPRGSFRLFGTMKKKLRRKENSCMKTALCIFNLSKANWKGISILVLPHVKSESEYFQSNKRHLISVIP